MRERKYVKFRIDMPDDTKLKIIDKMPERDLIQYIWFRLVLLAGKVNLMGELYLSKNIPYSIETLAIEINREEKDIELALNTFIKLEMVEVTEDKIYRVKNFAKHQNIKVDKKVEIKKDESEDIKEFKENSELKNQDNVELITINKKEKLKVDNNKEEIYKKDNVDIGNEKVINLEINNEKSNVELETQTTVNENMYDIKIGSENKKTRKVKRRKKNNIISDFSDDNAEEEVCEFKSGDIENTLKKGEIIVGAWKF
ncbi:putative phage replisome organizer [Clostridium saccharoperbutylacetonicum]|uniref:Replisome organizer region-containing protein n=1 Tax=Clostridium saccharoperbutylacetonicum N1-4(HMT) TaxID=931276 RepID=M1MSS1_9CLOT|nr:phage replisome organizer N-terminal domain-containing protein [Clostridium saccharoperbutylacetonicum]AGF59183.1 replisome organizer region-containing protein [Clostridium saccharoperbutylacetonicum N1-4(HMT)]NRT60030.1 putative phage replisome organizer [Clostridium saccharoperbutylacetonicum]NSB23342.1 putative phage replisome organizer [Clostridium saccharoperbutylacetonicum]NSB42712.1 putative phage replisome organizer [Clostridium saccharoperbutylacetonicum]